ncbi:kelch-like protein diablo isoform X1 [Centruroides sculpturatus]|uniref:kelch-like protein diablo isoform X1 n=2 Tax=Centruroides sculpturatus TaxID=218467 RepID=UPI000C6ED6C2|nr:kelch-like protein diablo isoform X1 [Centruroides sculpturatus]XP_023225751.1 kelch-like protein diablo isoform X1 [Centruroides sculpturatus]
MNKESRELPGKSSHFALLGQHTAGLWRFKKMTDIDIEVEKHSYPAHKSVLTCYSPYFRKILMESEKQSLKNIKLKSITAEAFGILLNYMYTGELDINCQNLTDVYQASKTLEIHEVSEHCNKILTNPENNVNNLLSIYVTAKKLGLRQTWQRALKAMARKFEEVIECKDFVVLNVEQICEFLSVDVIGARSEMVVYLAALKWLNHNYLEREQYIKQVIDNVRFQMMSLEEIVACYHPPLLPGIIEHAVIRNLLIDATSHVSAKMCGRVEKISDINHPIRHYLLCGRPFLFWDTFRGDSEQALLRERASRKIQASFRLYRLKKLFGNKKNKIITSQAIIRSFLVRNTTKYSRKFEDAFKGIHHTKDTGISANYIDVVTTDPSLQLLLQKSSSNFATDCTKNLKEVLGSIQLWEEPTLVVICGLDPMRRKDITNVERTMLRYNSNQHEWERCGKLPMSLHHTVAVCYEDSLYCIGGCDLEETQKGNIISTSSCYRFNYRNKSWFTMKTMHHGRMYHGVAVLFGMIYAVGGKDERKKLLSSIESYYPDTDTWFEVKNPLSHPRMGMGVVSHNDLLWVIGGMKQSLTEDKVYIVTDVECFDPKSNCWTVKYAKLPTPLTAIGCVEHKKKLYIVGGQEKVKNSLCSISEVYCYIDEEDEWLPWTPLPSPRHGVTAVSVGSTLFVIGGLTSYQKFAISDFISMDYINRSWNKCEPLPFPMCGIAAVSLPVLEHH